MNLGRWMLFGAVVAAVAYAARQSPDLIRYMKMRAM